jgi:hypothetical protein
VDNHALVRKIHDLLEKVQGYLKRTYNSSSDFNRRKFFNVTVATVVLLLLSCFMLVQVMSAIQISNTISTVGTLKLSVGIGVYSDANYANRLSTIDWGTLEPGATQSHSMYILIEGISPLTLSMSTSSWSPSSASNYLTLTWKFNNGQKIDPEKFAEVTLTLTVSAGITGIASFNYDLIVEGSG